MATAVAVTITDLMTRARKAIRNNDGFVYDVAAYHGMIYDNVKHMMSFRILVAEWLVDNTNKWAGLDLELEKERKRLGL